MKKRKPVYANPAQALISRRHERIRAIAEVPELHKENFEPRVFQSEKPVLIFFSADWCIPCRRFLGKPEPEHHNGQPAFIEGRPPNYTYPNNPGYNLWRILDVHKNSLDVATIDIMRSPELRERFEIDAVPYMMMFNQGLIYHQPKFLLVEDRVRWVSDMMKFFHATPARPYNQPEGKSLRIKAEY